MSNPFYNYPSSFEARYGVSDPLTAAGSSAMYASSLYSTASDRFRVPSSGAYGVPSSGAYGGTGGYGGIGAASSAASTLPYSQNPWTGATSVTDASALAGAKRSAEALYHQSFMGSNTIGQTEALFSTNPLVKRPRQDIPNNLPVYPQRPGEKDCPHYMLTRTCKFGVTCKFDHPVWVPEGGMPDWKEIPFVPTTEYLPERPGEPDCPYYLKTEKCKFGIRCKFNHPKDKLITSSGGELVLWGTESADKSELPERPSEPLCTFYAKTGKCKFGASCKFHHPKDIQIQPAGPDSASAGVKNNEAADGDSKPVKTFVPYTPAMLHNSKGLPVRLGEPDCPFYLKTGSCKYGATCRYNHPDRTSINPAVAPFGHSVMPSTPANQPIGVFGPPATILPNVDPRLAQAPVGVTPNIYPQRPGQQECDFYMKSGQCSFGERCKFHHPIDRSAPTATAKQAPVQNVKLTLAGLPRREGSVACAFYMKTGICKYGANCRFDHPPPGEAVALATTVQGTGATSDDGEEEKADAEPTGEAEEDPEEEEEEEEEEEGEKQ